MKRQLLRALLVLTISVVLIGCNSSTPTSSKTEPEVTSSKAEPAEKIVIRLAHSMPETNAYQLWATTFKSEAEKILGDKVEIKIFPNGQLGTQTENIEALKMGTLDAAIFGRHSQIDPRLEVLNLPYLFTSDEQMKKVLRGDEGKAVRKVIADMFEAQGIKLLGMAEAGFRQITSSKKIGKMDDLKGMVIRTPNTEVLLATFKAWGANPTPLDISEVYSALQQKVADGQENPFQIIYNNKFYEVQKFVTVTNHSTINDELQFSKKVWDSYPAEIQEGLAAAAESSSNIYGDAVVEMNKKLLADLETKGMTATYLPQSETDKLIDAARQIYPQFTKDPVAKKLVDDILAIK